MELIGHLLYEGRGGEETQQWVTRSLCDVQEIQIIFVLSHVEIAGRICSMAYGFRWN